MIRLELLEIAKPISLFNDEMILAIQDGEKTVIRRVIKGVPKCAEKVFKKAIETKGCFNITHKNGKKVIIRPPYKVGDFLYVQETWSEDKHNYLYRADFPYEDLEKLKNIMRWGSPKCMPRKAARKFLRVTDVQVERLQDITEDGVCEEGAEPLIQCPNERTIYYPDGGMEACYNTSCCKPCYFDKPYSELFGKLVWNSTVKKSDLDKYGWDANPWVFVIGFEKLEVE